MTARLKISIHEVETAGGQQYICLNAGEYTGVYSEIPVSDDDLAGMKDRVLKLADYYLALPDDAELPDGHDLTLAEIKASIRENIVYEPDVE